MDHIKHILALQEAESIIDGIKSDAQVYPDQLATVQGAFDEKKAKSDEAKTRLAALQAESADFKHTLELEKQRLEKSKKKMKDLTKVYEVQAMKKEIESTERSNVALDMKITEKAQEIELAEAAVAGMDEELQAAESALSEVKNEVEAKIGEFDAVLQEKIDQKKELEGKCDGKILGAYRLIRDRKYQDALVAALDGACQGCFMNIPPQMANLMMQNPSQLEKCPNCQRLIFWKEEADEALEA